MTSACQRAGLLLTLLGSALPLPACKRSTPQQMPAEQASLAPLEVAQATTQDGGQNGTWLFTYADPKGGFATVDKADAVPAPARACVRAVSPSWDDAKRRDGTMVYAIDVNQLLKDGKAPAKVLSREAFETAAMAQLPPGQFSPRHRAGSAPTTDAGVPSGGNLKPGQAPLVTVYGTSWCPACRAARAYLAEKKIPYADKDIEVDSAAAHELEEKATRMGVPYDRIPILDVRGRLMIGFDPERVQALLGETI